ncbi:YihY/virulence factor BrkB family protein [Demetria terragena]|uniref:YihY/virulence factor BrkB family protein n=1 Tax=Demetria terragena TaxID=63959 RepID=UPI00036F532F|nr:YihY/virulence factor BrkB family protein [Demetria terragena]
MAVDALETPDVIERPTEIPQVTAKPDVKVAFKRAIAKFGRDGSTDTAATLTYYGLFSLFPALAAVVALISQVVKPDAIMDILVELTGKSREDLSTVGTIVNNFADSKGAGLTLVIGVVTALWSASGYVGGFSRAMNRIYNVQEGRPVFALRPWLYVVTAIQALMIVTIIVATVLSGSLAKTIFDAVGLGTEAAGLWDMVKLPFMAFMVITIIGLLYWATPNVRKPRRMFFSWGALFAFVTWILATIGFATYVGLSAGAKYQETFGPFATAALFMFWLWLTNLIMLFGAELDAELERTRQLKSGLPAETMILLPLRNDAAIIKAQEKLDQNVTEAYVLRRDAEETLDERGMPVLDREPPAAVRKVADGGESQDPLEAQRAAKTTADDAGDDVTNQEPAPVTTAAMRATIEQERHERRTAELAEMRRQRVIRDRLEDQERKAAKVEAEREKKRAKEAAKQAAKEPKEEPTPIEEEWAHREMVRARYAPRRTPERDAADIERAKRRVTFRTEQAEKAANPPPPKPPKPVKVPMPSPLRDDIVNGREERRHTWYDENPRQPEVVPLPKRRDVKGSS